MRGINREMQGELKTISPINPSRWPPMARIGLLLIVLTGMGIRVAVYLQDRALWSDEARLAMNIVPRSALGLLHPLERNQAAPVGFLLAEKAVESVFGGSEYALRFIPLLSGLALLVIGGLFAIRFLTPLQGILLLLFLALEQHLIHYCVEVKQYESDAAVAMAIVFVTLPVIRSAEETPESRPRGLAAWTTTSALAVWFSHPAVFTVAACCLAVIGAVRRKVLALYLSGIAGASFAVNYFLFCKSTQQDKFLHTYWAKWMRPKGGLMPALDWLGLCIKMAGAYALRDRVWVVGLLLAAGVIWLLLRSRWTLIAAIGGMALCLVAACLRFYPFRGRLLLFTMPGMGLAMTAPAAARPLPIRCGAAGLLLCGLWPLVPLIWRLDYPPTVPSGVREALAAGYPRVRPGDSVCMLGYSFELNDYYQTRFNFSRQNVHEISLDCGGEAQDAAQCAATGGRVWVVVSDTVPGCPAAPKKFRDAMDRLARRADYQESGDTYMALYVH